LVVGSLKGSSKEDKAKKDGVKILTEDEFLIMIGRKG
jgi:NAD-dependent DNA ligase